jgi:hypothetical protein
MIEAWNRFRDDSERLGAEIGTDLRDLLSSGEWALLDSDARRLALDEARKLMHERQGLVRDTRIEWDEDDPRAGYDEKSGVIHLPTRHLEAGSPEEALRDLAEEMRHAWEFDVIAGRLEHPLGEHGRRGLAVAYADYDADNLVSYTSNVLEGDAQDFAVDVMCAYRGAD